MGKRLFIVVIICLFRMSFLLAEKANPFSYNTFTLSASTEAIDLSGSISYLRDAENNINLGQILTLNDEKKWRICPTNYLKFGYQNDFFWLCVPFDVQDSIAEKWTWSFDASPTQLLEFYHYTEGGGIVSDTFGIDYPFAYRDEKSRLQAFSFLPKKGKNWLFLHFHNDLGTFIGKTKLTRHSVFVQEDIVLSNIWVAIFTFLWIAVIVAVCLNVAFGERIYFYYAAYIFCSSMVLVNNNGFALEWFWADMPRFVFYGKILWSFWTGIFFIKFIQRLLFLKRHEPLWLHDGVDIVVWVFILLTAIPFLGFDMMILRTMVTVANSFMAFAAAFVLLLIFMSLKSKNSTTYYFLLAFSPFAVVVILLILRNYNLIHWHFLQSSYLLATAQILEAFLLFFALLKRFQILQRAKQEALEAELRTQKRLQTERERISRDLHDNVGAQLSLMISGIERIVSQKNDIENLKSRLSEMRLNAKQTILTLRETIWAIRKEAISVEDFYDRFKLFARQQTQEIAGLKLEFNENISENHALNPNVALHIYRICQEILNNCVKYAQAQNLTFELEANADFWLKMRITDNGIGFDLAGLMAKNSENLNQTSGFGIENMRSRAAEIGADFHIFSTVNVGTSIEIVLKKGIK